MATKMIGGEQMKVKSDQPTAVEIILSDNEVRSVIRSLIEVANGKGYELKDVQKALKREWNEMHPKVKPNYSFTEDEKQFLHKVDMFIEEYRDGIIEAYDKESRYHGLHCDGDPKKIERLINHYKFFIGAGYCNFCREETITIDRTVEYARNLLGAKKNYYVSPDECLAISRFFDALYYPVSHDERPKVGVKDIPSENRLFYNDSYHNFLNQYSYQNRHVVMAVLTTVWFIREYY